MKRRVYKAWLKSRKRCRKRLTVEANACRFLGMDNANNDFVTDPGFRYASANGGRARFLPAPVQFETEELLTIGPIVVTSCGEENMYFTTADGTIGFVKCF